MEEKYLKKFAEIVEKLRTADNHEAYRILFRLQYGVPYESFLHKAALSLVKKDFSLDKREAIVLLAFAIAHSTLVMNVDHGHGFYVSWYNSKSPNQAERISIVIDCSNLKKVVMQIAHTIKWRTNALNFDDHATPPPAELKAIVAGLEGFSEKKPGLWVRPLGEVKNLAQAKRLIKPIWNEVFNAIKPFGDAW